MREMIWFYQNYYFLFFSTFRGIRDWVINSSNPWSSKPKTHALNMHHLCSHKTKLKLSPFLGPVVWCGLSHGFSVFCNLRPTSDLLGPELSSVNSLYLVLLRCCSVKCVTFGQNQEISVSSVTWWHTDIGVVLILYVEWKANEVDCQQMWSYSYKY